MALIVADHITKDYSVGDVVVNALQGVGFEIEPASFVSFVGPSGSGKTTLLNRGPSMFLGIHSGRNSVSITKK